MTSQAQFAQSPAAAGASDENDSFFELLSRHQSRRIDDQRCSVDVILPAPLPPPAQTDAVRMRTQPLTTSVSVDTALNGAAAAQQGTMMGL